ncbi:MAG TPA: DNA-binding protein WhiA [Candidatus Limnocylindrales bacterium]|nr:DNA-binding protein WhiA [Candidatus Limnocylindrales bacterium]
MTAADLALVAALRAELAAVDPQRPCDREAERLGLAGGRHEPILGRLEVRLDRHGSGTRVAPSGSAFDWDGSPEHCRLAWLRGRFLGHGSLSLANGRTHLELVVSRAEAPILASRLAAVELPASWRIRRGTGVVTAKGGDAVGLFLRRIGAGPSLLELEARQVARSLRGELNRVLNAESANLGRSVIAAGRQLAAIDALDAVGRLGDEPEPVRRVAAARRETPEATLTDLATRLAIHRSTVQRALERLERQALRDERASRAGAPPLA